MDAFLSDLWTMGWVMAGNLSALTVRINWLLTNHDRLAGKKPTWPRSYPLPKRYFEYSFWLARLSLAFCTSLAAVSYGGGSSWNLFIFGYASTPIILVVNRKVAIQLLKHWLNKHHDDGDDDSGQFQIAA